MTSAELRSEVTVSRSIILCLVNEQWITTDSSSIFCNFAMAMRTGSSVPERSFILRILNRWMGKGDIGLNIEDNHILGTSSTCWS
eukprot:5745985-Ditylum_brightwellii.AAC.1